MNAVSNVHPEPNNGTQEHRAAGLVPNSSWEYGLCILVSLLRLGLQYFVYASGARSAPLLHGLFTLQRFLAKTSPLERAALLEGAVGKLSPIAAAATVIDPASAQLRTCGHIDERGAAYHALGYARSSGRAAGVIVTSGTALANVFPAVVEAAKCELPLVVLSADRPAQLQGIRANQTMIQRDFFAAYAAFSAELPVCAESTVGGKLSEWQQLISRGMQHAQGTCSTGAVQQGVVHFNIPFEKPLLGAWTRPVSHIFQILQHPAAGATAADNHASSKTAAVQSAAALQAMAQTLAATVQRGAQVLIISALYDGTDESHVNSKSLAAQVSELAVLLAAPVFVDGASPLRLHPYTAHANDDGAEASPLSLSFPLLLEALQELNVPEWERALQFTTVLHIGSELLSQQLVNWLAKHPPESYCHIERLSAHYDPMQILPPHGKTHALKASRTGSAGIQTMLKTLLTLLRPLLPSSPQPAAQRLLQKMMQLDVKLRAHARAHSFKGLTELGAFRTLLQLRPQRPWNLFIGNSMPVRSFNLLPLTSFFKGLNVSRGSSGIDGLVAQCSGIAAALRRPVLAVVGDLTLLHDLSSLSFLQQYPLGIVVINNKEGSIFQHLPLRAFMPEADWERFVFRHDLTFKGITMGWGLAYARVLSEIELGTVLTGYLAAGKSFVLELQVDAAQNIREHKHFIKTLSRVLAVV